jgi:hypothetical protein
MFEFQQFQNMVSVYNSARTKNGDVTLKGLSYEIDFENVDEN